MIFRSPPLNIQRPQSKQSLPKGAKRVFKGVIFDVYQWRQKMFDGSVQTFEKLKRADTVIIVPVTKEGKIILTTQKQPAKKSFIGVVGGRVENGESIIEAAHRELLEEAGCKTDKLELWNAVQPVGKIEWSVYTFIAKNCEIICTPGLDAGEKIELKTVTFEEFVDIALQEEFDDLEIVKEIIRAKLDPEKMNSLRRKLLS